MAFLNRHNEAGKVSLGRKLLAFVTSISMVMTLVTLPVPASADDSSTSDGDATTSTTTDLGAPTVSKTVTQPDKDGNFQLTLSVTGKSQSSTTQTHANVIFVADVSGSMKTRYGDTTRIEAAKAAIKAAGETILDQNGTNVQLTTFSDTADASNAFTSDKATFDSQVDGMNAEGGTNWEDALTKAEALAKTSNVPTYIIFVSDGDPTFRDSQIYSDGDYNTYTQKRVGWLGWSWVYPDGQDYYDDYNNGENGIYGTGNSDPQGWNFTAADAVANRIVNTDGYKLYTLGVSSDVQKMNRLTANAHYQANDPDAMNKALSDIAKAITNARSYKNVKITDTLSGDVVSGTASDGNIDANTLQVKVTDKDGKDVTSSQNLATPTVSGQNITWDLGSTTLQDGYTYSVTADVKLTEQAYTDAAALMNGEKAKSSNISKDGDTVKAYSNTDSGNKVDYTEFTTTNGVEDAGSEKTGSVDFTRPTVPVPVSTLTVSKKWDGNGTKPDVTANVQQDSKDYKTLTLNADNNWSSTVYVPACPEAHTYSVTEDTTNLNGWTLESYKWGDGETNTQAASGTIKGQNQSATATITNKLVTYGFRVYKTNGTGDGATALQGATFTLAPQGGSASEQITSSDGIASWSQLTPGTYTVEETKVPSGYQKLDGSHTLVIDQDGKATWDGKDITTTGNDTKDGTTYFQVTVANNSVANLPATGSIGVWPMLAGGVALVAAGVAFVIFRRREQ
ncbi:MAG: VWA domain-containing protein [Atopobiaceae bacterium]